MHFLTCNLYNISLHHVAFQCEPSLCTGKLRPEASSSWSQWIRSPQSEADLYEPLPNYESVELVRQNWIWSLSIIVQNHMRLRFVFTNDCGGGKVKVPNGFSKLMTIINGSNLLALLCLRCLLDDLLLCLS